MKRITLIFGGLTLIDVAIEKNKIGEYSSADLLMNNRYIGQLDTDTHYLKYIHYLPKNTYKVERR